MTDERRARIEAMADELAAGGTEPSAAAVWARVHGHRPDVQQVMRERRAAQSGAVAVAEQDEDESPPPTVRELEEDVQQLEAAYDSWHASLEAIWALEESGPLDLPTFSRARWLEYQLTENLKQQERLRPLLDAAKLKDAVEAAVAQWNAGIGEATALVDEGLLATAHLASVLTRLVAHFGWQGDALALIRSRRREQEFAIRSGLESLIDLYLTVFPQDFRAADMVALLVGNPPTEGRKEAALSQCARLQPFPPRAIERYLTEMEGVSHASNS